MGYVARALVRAVVAAAAMSFAGLVSAKELKLVATIPIPGEPLVSYDISFVDQKTQRLYLADRSNKALDIFDTKDNKFVGRVTGFVGAKLRPDGRVDSNHSGPDGVVVIGAEAWVGDGDSTVKIVNLKTLKITDTISTGGKSRLDEMIFDRDHDVFIGVNNAEQPPFATLISTRAGHKVIAKVVFEDATDGAEQPDYNARDRLFYVSIPELSHDKSKGGVAAIDPQTGKIVKMLTVDNCRPNGLAFGPNEDFLLGCSTRTKEADAVIMNAKTGKVVARVPNIGGADMVAHSRKNAQYYFGGGNNPGGAALGVIDDKTYKLVQTIPMKGASTPHSVAVNNTNGHVLVPGGAGEGGCSCLQVFAPQ